MAKKFSADGIEQAAIKTRESCRGRPGDGFARTLTIGDMRNYVDRVLYLCKELKKAKAKIK